MSNEDESRQKSPLVEPGSSLYERVAAATVGIGFVAFGLAMAAVFELTSVTDSFAGLTLANLFGVANIVVGGAVIGLGVASWRGYVDTTPDDTSGLVAGALFGGIWFTVGGLFASQTLGFGALLWVPFAFVFAGIALAVTVFPPEDVGSTLPAGAFAVLVGALFLTDVIGAEWEWSPEGFGATITPAIAIPVLTFVAVLLTSWAAAKAYQDFGSRGRQAGAYMLISLNAIAILSVLVLLLAFVLSKGLPVFLTGVGLKSTWPFVEWPFLLNGVALTNDVNGVYPAIVGTFWLVVGAVIFAVPLGVGAAVFLTEYAEEGRFNQVVEIATNGLWSTPSIVFGLFGYAFLVPRFGNSTTLLAGMLVLGFMLLPLVVITSREAILSVPKEYRDGSAALGVTQWETIKSVVLPASMPGILTGVILGVGRIAGETAPILLVMTSDPFPSKRQAADIVDLGFAFTSQFPFVSMSVVNSDALLSPSSALPYQLYAVITAGVGQRQAFAWATAVTLLLVVMSFYAVGIASRKYFRGKLTK